MTTDETKAPLPDIVEAALIDCQKGKYFMSPDWGLPAKCPVDIIRAHIAALEASLNSAVSAHQACLDEKNEKIAELEAEIELQKDLRQRAQDITDRSLMQMHHYETLAAKSAANVYVLQEENKRLREALLKYASAKVTCEFVDGGSRTFEVHENCEKWAKEALAQTDGKAGE